MDIDENAVHDAPEGMSRRLPMIGSGLGPGGKCNDLRVNLLRSRDKKIATNTVGMVSMMCMLLILEPFWRFYSGL